MRRFIPFVILAALVGAYVGYRIYLARRPFEWSGTVEAHTATVGSRVGGRVKEVLKREGEHVKAGEALVIFEPGDLPAQKAMAEAQVAQAEAALDKLKNGARPEEIEAAKARAQTAVAAYAETKAGARSEEIAAAEHRLTAAEATLDKARGDAARARSLFASGSIAQAELDGAEAAYKAAQAQRDALAEQVRQLRNGARQEELSQAQARAKEAQASATLVTAGARVEDLRAAQAQVDAARARLDQILVAVEELTVRAPRDSRVESLDVRPGDLLLPHATAAKLYEDGQLFVRIYVPETELGRIRVGQEVPIAVDTFPDKTFLGIVEHINDVGEYSPRNLQTADERADYVFGTRIALKTASADELRAGMTAIIKVPK